MLLSIPSPSVSVINLGPITLHYYAVCIIIGIAVAIYVGKKRYVASGGNGEEVLDASIWAIPFGIIGGRIYHVISSPQQYFGANGEVLEVFQIWKGGLGIWGAISIGALGAYLYFRKHKTTLSYSKFLDALAPGILLAQAIGRVGNWFNQELFGKPTTLPWGLKIDALNRPGEYKAFETFHPTFLYEALWCLFIAFLLIKLPGILRKLPKKSGDIFVIYVLGYTIGRLGIESIRIDDANLILGLRVNIWVSILVIIGSVSFIFKSRSGVKGA